MEPIEKDVDDDKNGVSTEGDVDNNLNKDVDEAGTDIEEVPGRGSIRYRLRSAERGEEIGNELQRADRSKNYVEKDSFYVRAEYHECFSELPILWSCPRRNIKDLM